MLRIVAIADPVAVEYQTDAMMGIKVARGHSPQEVATRLASLPEVVYILWVGGRYDLLVEVVSNDHDAFLSFLETEIHGQCGHCLGRDNDRPQKLQEPISTEE